MSNYSAYAKQTPLVRIRAETARDTRAVLRRLMKVHFLRFCEMLTFTIVFEYFDLGQCENVWQSAWQSSCLATDSCKNSNLTRFQLSEL